MKNRSSGGGASGSSGKGKGAPSKTPSAKRGFQEKKSDNYCCLNCRKVFGSLHIVQHVEEGGDMGVGCYDNAKYQRYITSPMGSPGQRKQSMLNVGLIEPTTAAITGKKP